MAVVRDTPAGSQSICLLPRMIVVRQLSSTVAAKPVVPLNNPRHVPGQRHVKTNPKVLPS